MADLQQPGNAAQGGGGLMVGRRRGTIEVGREVAGEEGAAREKEQRGKYD